MGREEWDRAQWELRDLQLREQALRARTEDAQVEAQQALRREAEALGKVAALEAQLEAFRSRLTAPPAQSGGSRQARALLEQETLEEAERAQARWEAFLKKEIAASASASALASAASDGTCEGT